MTRHKNRRLLQFSTEVGRYSAVGLFNTASGFAVFALLTSLSERPLFVTLSVYLSHAIVSPVAYYAHRRWVFRSHTSFLRGFVKFQLAYLIPLTLNGPLLYSCLVLLGTNPLLTQATITIILISSTFLLNRHFVFARSMN